jgi:aldose 1-epimerase
MSDLQLRDDSAVLTVSTGNGGRWTSLRVGDLELIGRGGTSAIDWGNYPMAPYAGRIRRGLLSWGGASHQLPVDKPPHAIHGVTLDRPWDIVDRARNGVMLRCTLDSRWPWPGHVIQQVRLDGNQLFSRLEVHADDVAMPAWTGYHPWFPRRLARGGPVDIELTATGVLPRDDDGMPTAEQAPVPPGPWDDAFVDVTWPVRLRWEGAIGVDITSDARYVVVFDEKPDAVCVEPQTAPPNAAELGLAATVEPGAPLVMQMTWTWG